MKKLYFLLIMFLSLSSIAQITIHSTDIASVNDTIRYSTSTTNISSRLAQTGINQSWDFTGLVPDFQEIAKFQTAASINPVYAFSFFGSTYGTQGRDVSVGVLQGSEVFNFYTKNTASLTGDGRGITLNGIPLSQTYPDSIYHFPMNYGDKDSCTYVSNEVNAVLGTLRTSGKRVNTVDGWGSITTPFGTFDCIRVKSTIRNTDTLKTTAIPIPIPFTTNITEYKWIATGKKIPVLEIDVVQSTIGGSQTTIRYPDRARREVFVNQADFSANKNLFAANNMSDTCMFTDNSGHLPTNWTWTITPNTYVFVGGTNAHSQNPKLYFTAAGNYAVNLKVDYNAGSDDTLKTDFITVTGPVVPVVANFSADKRTTTPSSVVSFYDSSSGNPFIWQWTFTPATVTFINGTSAISQNPKVVFNQPGTYTVSLFADNSSSNDLATKNNYITCSPNSGVNEIKDNEEVTLFPNPAREYLHIRSGNQPIDKIEVLDIAGKLIPCPLNIQGTTGHVETMDLHKGIYIIRLTLDNGQLLTKRFIAD